MKISDLIVNCLETEGVEYVFGIVGQEVLDLAESLSKSQQIQFINVRHESGAAFMADVYGRLSHKPGVCLSTLGPGATNLLTGVASAQLDHSPVVALMGQAKVSRQHPESHQYLDIAKIFQPATKWNTQILDALTVPTTIQKAFRLVQMEKPGSVALVIPENILTTEAYSKPISPIPLPDTVPSMQSIESARTIIENSKKPFVLVGNGVVRHRAYDEILNFINLLQAPLTHSFMAKGIVNQDHPSNCFTFGFNENDEVLRGITEADLLIVIGFDFVEQLPNKWNETKIPVLHIDSSPAEVNEYYPVVSECVGNIKMTLQLLNGANLPTKSWTPAAVIETIKKSYQINSKQSQTTESLWTIENILHCIETVSPEDTIVISDVGAHKLSIARTYQPKKPNRLIISNGLASMGIAIPGTIGAKLACPNDPVICITGDGGALMHFAEIETAKRLGLSFVIIVLNNGMLKLEVEQMIKKFGESSGTTFQNPDFVKLAQSFGIKGVQAKNSIEFETVLKKAMQNSDGITLIDAVL